MGDLLGSGLRFVLGFWMLIYGVVKIPGRECQFPEPGILRLLDSYGESSPMGLLWTFMGSSPAYTLCAGLAECAGGVLLLFRRTALLGAMVSAGVMAHVVVLNFCYDVPVVTKSNEVQVLWVDYLASRSPKGGERFATLNLRTNESAFEWSVRTSEATVTNRFAYSLEGDQLRALEGETPEGHVELRLRRVERSEFLLVNRGFHWISPVPFNR